MGISIQRMYSKRALAFQKNNKKLVCKEDLNLICFLLAEVKQLRHKTTTFDTLGYKKELSFFCFLNKKHQREPVQPAEYKTGRFYKPLCCAQINKHTSGCWCRGNRLELFIFFFSDLGGLIFFPSRYFLFCVHPVTSLTKQLLAEISFL